MALGFIQPLTEVSNRNFLWGAEWKADELTAICEPSV
jgi:hypothetical protein